VKICNAFTEDNFKILMKNNNLDRQKLFVCIVRRLSGSYQMVKLLLNDKRVNPSSQNKEAIRYEKLLKWTQNSKFSNRLY